GTIAFRDTARRRRERGPHTGTAAGGTRRRMGRTWESPVPRGRLDAEVARGGHTSGVSRGVSGPQRSNVLLPSTATGLPYTVRESGPGVNTLSTGGSAPDPGTGTGGPADPPAPPGMITQRTARRRRTPAPRSARRRGGGRPRP